MYSVRSFVFLIFHILCYCFHTLFYIIIPKTHWYYFCCKQSVIHQGNFLKCILYLPSFLYLCCFQLSLYLFYWLKFTFDIIPFSFTISYRAGCWKYVFYLLFIWNVLIWLQFWNMFSLDVKLRGVSYF